MPSGFCKLVFSARSIEYSLIRACFRQGSLFFLQARVFISPCVFLTRSIVSSASFSIHQSVRVFDKVECLFCKLQYWSVRAFFWQGRLSLLQASVLISPCVFLTRSIVSSANFCKYLSVRTWPHRPHNLKALQKIRVTSKFHQIWAVRWCHH